MDYEKWASEAGMAAWSYADCLPYFKRLETTVAGEDDYRGGKGPLILERGPATSPLFQAFFEAGRQAGIPFTTDVNGYRQEGFARFDANRYRGRRLSAARAYLHPVMGRSNLTVTTRAHTTRILFDGSRAIGVEYRKGRRLLRVTGEEVIVCGGAINTPQLLMLSGLGPSRHLEQLGIGVVNNLPGVGQNLQDHLEVYIQHASKLPVSLQPQLAQWRKPWIGLQWLMRRGPGTSNHFEGGGFVRSNDRVSYPNLMLHFLPIAIRYDGSVPAGGHGYQVHVGPMYSDVRGSLFLKSTDPFDKPGLRFNYLSTRTDRREWVEAVRFVRHVLSRPAFDDYDGGELSPGPEVSTDEQILEWVARDAETALHPCGTARMGIDSMSVVDPGSLRVHGIDGLRVVDASVMPSITNANIYAPVMMIAERASDMILGNPQLPPEHVDWYRG